MATSCASYRCATFLVQAVAAGVIIISVFLVHPVAAGGRDQCPPFSCGNLHNVSSPFRRPGDPPFCGVKAYELVCSSSKATIRINKGTYFVSSINNTDKSFWVVGDNLNIQNSCLLPFTDEGPTFYKIGSHVHVDLEPDAYYWACFVNCSQAVTNNSLYHPVACLSANASFVYVSVSRYSCLVYSLEPSCGYLATVPLASYYYPPHLQMENASYEDIIEFVKKGFSVQFPHDAIYLVIQA